MEMYKLLVQFTIRKRKRRPLLLLGALSDRARRASLSKLPRDAGTFNLNAFNNDFCVVFFRFEKDHIVRLLYLFQIPEIVELENRAIVTGPFALCLLLRRLSYPNRYVELMGLFRREVSVLCRTFDYITHFVHEKYAHLLELGCFRQSDLERFSRAVSAKGCPLSNCIGFIDGTVRPICRPSTGQKLVFNGHKRIHALKFQSVIMPHGIIEDLYGPIEGRRHDSKMLRDSSLLNRFESLPLQPNSNDNYVLYGDPAYFRNKYLLAPFRGAQLTTMQAQFNKDMATVRQTVEWGFAAILARWAYIDFKKQLKLKSNAVGRLYKVATILTNIHTCLYSNQIAMYFELSPPKLDDYLKGRIPVLID